MSRAEVIMALVPKDRPKIKLMCTSRMCPITSQNEGNSRWGPVVSFPCQMWIWFGWPFLCITPCSLFCRDLVLSSHSQLDHSWEQFRIIPMKVVSAIAHLKPEESEFHFACLSVMHASV